MIQVRPKEQGLLIKNLLLRSNFFTLQAKGEMNQNDTQQITTRLHGNLTTNHLAETLTEIGLGDLLTAHHSVISFDLLWPGTLWQFSRDQLNGTLNFTTTQGIFKNISTQTNNKMNLGRMLSILSIQALPQHFASHFSDMTEKGFSFNTLKGSVELTPNKIKKIGVYIHGALAEVLLQGCADLENKKIHFITKINPNVTGSLPFLATLAGGPLIGAVGFVANQFIEPLVGKLSESYYAIQGDWHNPETKKISRIKINDHLETCNNNQDTVEERSDK
jgi:uncharacterized protein YhdP